jgi:hypothetical protein
MNSRKGFTIIELMLAMTFVATLMVAVAFLVIRVTAIYQKGLSIRSVNQVGRNPMVDFTRAVADSPVDDSVERENYFSARYENDNQMVGAFYIGRYSYLWNTGTAINAGERIQFKNQTGVYDFRLIRIDDVSRAVCAAANDLGDDYLLDLSAVAQVRDAVPVELLTLSDVEVVASTEDSSESDLALYDLRVYQPTINQATGHAFYSATFILGSLRGIDITANGNYCVNMSETLNTDFSYCSFNKFNFAMTTSSDMGGKHDDFGHRSY